MKEGLFLLILLYNTLTTFEKRAGPSPAQDNTIPIANSKSPPHPINPILADLNGLQQTITLFLPPLKVQ